LCEVVIDVNKVNTEIVEQRNVLMSRGKNRWNAIDGLGWRETFGNVPWTCVDENDDDDVATMMRKWQLWWGSDNYDDDVVVIEWDWYEKIFIGVNITTFG